jgi:hypothetical protein
MPELGIDNATIVAVVAFAAIALAVAGGAIAFALWWVEGGEL